MHKLKKRTAFSLIELFVVVAIIAIIGVAVIINLNAPKASADLVGTAKQMTSVLRQAQSESMSDQQGGVWGVYFSNPAAGKPFYAIISSSTYSSATVVSQYNLPLDIGFVTSTIPQGSSLTVQFTPPSGASPASTSLAIYLIPDPSLQENVVVLGNGQVSYTSGTPSVFSSASVGDIWVIDELNNRVVGFSSTGTYIAQIGCASGPCPATSTSGGFESLSGFINIDGVAVDPSGNVWVSDYQDSRVEKFSATGTYLTQFPCLTGPCPATSTLGGFENPGSIAIDSNGNIWVADFGNNRVEKFSSTGAYITQIGCGNGACPATSTSGGFNDPTGVAVDASGNVWVSDFENSRVEKFSSSGAYITQLPCANGACPYSSTSGYLNYPNGVTVDSNGNVWVVDYQNGRVEKFSSSGAYITQIGCQSGYCTATTTNGGFDGEYGDGIVHAVAADTNGNVWVSDEGDNRVEKFSATGIYLTQVGCVTGWCTLTSTNGEFYYTGNIAVH